MLSLLKRYGKAFHLEMSRFVDFVYLLIVCGFACKICYTGALIGIFLGQEGTAETFVGVFSGIRTASGLHNRDPPGPRSGSS